MSKKNGGVASNVAWKLAERLSAQIVTLIVSIILARLLEPSHYGIISIVTIFITLANVFVSDGFGSALIQKKDADDLDFSSVLSFNILFSIFLYLVLFLFAPYISAFYGDGYELLCPVIRVLGLRIIASGINSVQQAYVARKMIFKKFFLATLIGTIVSAIIGIWMAYNGYGVWSLVAQYLINTTVDTIILGISLKWWPGLKVSLARLKELLKYGWKILGASLLVTGFMELRALIIGKMYSSDDLAYYDKGKQFPNLIVTNVNTSIGAVLFPKMSQQQNNIPLVKETTRKSIRFSSYLMSPMMLGLAAIATSFVSVILTDKWLPCVPLLQLFCIIYLFQPIHTANMQAIKAIGRSDVYMWLEIIKKTIEIIVLLITMFFSVNAIVIGMAVMTTSFVFLNAFPNKKLLGYSIKEQLKDIFPSIFMGALMFAIVYSLSLLPLSPIGVLAVQVVAGVSVYLLMSLITKNNEFTYLISLFKAFLIHRSDN
jgi:O-antigen/teichoic acid export membrane protein